MSANQNEALRFLLHLDPAATFFTFQTFDDNEERAAAFKAKHKHADWKITRVLHGSLDQHAAALNALNAQGAGVFVTVNETDGKGRKEGNIVRIRAAFADLDGAPLEPVLANGMQPHIVTETSPGRWHAYWRVCDLPLDQFEAVQKNIAARFHGDASVCDLPRVMRLPGFMHRKGAPFRSRLVQINDREVYAGKVFECASGDGHDQQIPDDVHIENIRSGKVYYNSLLALSARWIGRGQDAASVIYSLQDLMNQSSGPRNERWQARFASIPEMVASAGEKFGGPLDEMNERCAAGSVKGKFRVIKWVPDARHPYQRIAEFNSKGDFCNAVVNPKIEIPKFNSKGEKIGTEPIGRGKWWLGQDGRQEFDGIDYRPGQPEKIEVHDRHNGRTLCILNMYSGFAVEPDFEDSAKKCPLYLAHVHNNVAGGNEELNTYILDWEASGVQHPENPGRSALSMRGDPGAGKGVFALYYGGIFGRHFLHVTNKDHVTGKFNAHSAETCLIFVDEALYAEIRADAQILKTLTSETTKILERKGIDPVEIDNYARLMFATNEEHPIQIEHNDRRYCAIYVQNNSAWVNETSEQVKADKRAEYFRPIIDEMNNGGRAALLGFLLRRDISKFNPERIPSTTERNAQKLMSAPAGDKIIIEFAIDGHLPGAVSAERAWLARANGEGCLYPALRERGGSAVARMTDMALASLLKRWKFERHPLGDGAGWSAPKLADLRLAISMKYPGRKWDERIGDWGQCVDEAVVEDEHKAKEAEDDPPF